MNSNPTGEFVPLVYDPNNISYPGYDIIGICSICGGDVITYSGAWHSIYPPIPTCNSCGAIQRQNRGPIIPMEPVRRPRYYTDSGFVEPWDVSNFEGYIRDQDSTYHSE